MWFFKLVFNHNILIEKIIELSRSFISEAGFNLIYMFPVDGNEPGNRKSDSSTSAYNCSVVSPVMPVLHSVKLF